MYITHQRLLPFLLRRKLDKETAARKIAEEACRTAEANLAAANLASPVIKVLKF